MLQFDEPVEPVQVLWAIGAWVEALGRDDYQAASQMLCHDLEPWPAGYQSVLWDASTLKTIIENYGSPDPWPDGRKFRVTDPASTSGGPIPCHEVNLVEEGIPGRPDLVGDAWYDLPLNGEWSDLTATFDLRRYQGKVVLELLDIHVM